MDIKTLCEGHQHVSENHVEGAYTVGTMPELSYTDAPCKWAEMEHEHFTAVEVTQ